MTPLQRFYNQIPNGLSNAFRNAWTNITGQTDGYFRMLLGYDDLEPEKRMDFVQAAVNTYHVADTSVYDDASLRKLVNGLALALVGKEVL